MAKRRARSLQNEAYEMQRLAHAEGRQLRYPILTNPEGEIIGNRGKWQAAVRSIVELTVNRSIREYKKQPSEWKWLLKTIQRELDLRFTFVYPVKPEILSSYLSMILSNDRYKWHKHYVATSGGQHEDCPDEAFAALRQFWESPEGKAKSQTMKGIRAKVGKDLSFCSEQDLEVTPTRTRPSLSASEDFHSPGSEQVKVLHNMPTKPSTSLYYALLCLPFSIDIRLRVPMSLLQAALTHAHEIHRMKYPDHENVPWQFANAYDTPMCSDWVMEAPTEYEATETFASQAHSPEVVNSTSLQQVCNIYMVGLYIVICM